MATAKHTQDLSLSLTNLIAFNIVDKDYKLTAKKRIRLWLQESIEKEGYRLGFLSFNLCSDEFLLKMNKKHLKHDYLTDIITFNLVEGKELSGDVYISIDRVKENAKLNKVKHMREELLRVFIHGVLHLCGYNDKTTKQVKAMRAKEDYYLSLYA
ncbi:MAG: rRNA maturation RNase YbeY [Bacteroidia bacterium]|jgi:rRNA maturation RNase YbeY|nr:rRNA maturation RNase YbeY [Bacteroidia bacterium]